MRSLGEGEAEKEKKKLQLRVATVFERVRDVSTRHFGEFYFTERTTSQLSSVVTLAPLLFFFPFFNLTFSLRTQFNLTINEKDNRQRGGRQLAIYFLVYEIFEYY